MANNTSLVSQILRETAARNCHSCISQFRGNRRRDVEYRLFILKNVFCQYSATVPKQPSFHELEEFDHASDVDIDVTMFNKQETACYCDTVIYANFTIPSNILYALCTSLDKNMKSSIVIDSIL